MDPVSHPAAVTALGDGFLPRLRVFDTSVGRTTDILDALHDTLQQRAARYGRASLCRLCLCMWGNETAVVITQVAWTWSAVATLDLSVHEVDNDTAQTMVDLVRSRPKIAQGHHNQLQSVRLKFGNPVSLVPKDECIESFLGRCLDGQPTIDYCIKSSCV